MSAPPPTLEQREATRRARDVGEEAKAKELEADVAWLRRAAGELDTVLRTADRFEKMVAR